MIIGTTKELKNHEYRVGLTPDNVLAYTAKGHTVYVETGAGVGAGFADEEYIEAGAKILATPKEVFDISFSSFRVVNIFRLGVCKRQKVIIRREIGIDKICDRMDFVFLVKLCLYFRCWLGFAFSASHRIASYRKGIHSCMITCDCHTLTLRHF